MRPDPAHVAIRQHEIRENPYFTPTRFVKHPLVLARPDSIRRSAEATSLIPPIRMTIEVQRVPVANPPGVGLEVHLRDEQPAVAHHAAELPEGRRRVVEVLEGGVADGEVKGAGSEDREIEIRPAEVAQPVRLAGGRVLNLLEEFAGRPRRLRPLGFDLL